MFTKGVNLFENALQKWQLNLNQFSKDTFKTLKKLKTTVKLNYHWLKAQPISNSKSKFAYTFIFKCKKPQLLYYNSS